VPAAPLVCAPSSVARLHGYPLGGHGPRPAAEAERQAVRAAWGRGPPTRGDVRAADGGALIP